MTTQLPSAKSEGCATLALHMRADKIGFTPEYAFAKSIGRKWRVDFMLAKGIVVEVNGAIWTQGRHSRGSGLENDYEKLNECALMGYRVLQFSTGMVKDGTAIEVIRRAVNG